MLRKFFGNKKGQGLVEYGLIIAGVALICAAAISVFGHKTSDLIAAVATVLPGAHDDDNAAITSGKLIETTAGTQTTPIDLNLTAIETNSDSGRLENNVTAAAADAAGTDFGGLIFE